MGRRRSATDSPPCGLKSSSPVLSAAQRREHPEVFFTSPSARAVGRQGAVRIWAPTLSGAGVQRRSLANLLTGRHTRIRTNPVTEMLFLSSARREEVRHREAIERIIDFVELERYRHAPVDGLPFGIQKLVGFARALALEPAILMLDEPSAGLNRDEREDLARFILRIKHELGITVIWIEHDLEMVADLADRIHVLDYGRTLAEGAPGDVLKHPRVIAAYIGTAAALR
jgi:ABC-type branched-subunit amino acid transport system ATPase component